MKKGIHILVVLVLLGSVSLNAQTGGGKQNYVFVDFAPLLAGVLEGGFGIGAGYERAINDRFSVAGYFDYLSVGDISAFDVLLRPRFYPLGSALSGFYVGGIVGYGMVTIQEDNYEYGGYGEEKKESSYGMFTFGAEVGWKFIFASGLSAEPWLGYVVGEFGGIKFGATFGYAWGGGTSRGRSSPAATRRK
jgi:hypothetical protein